MTRFARAKGSKASNERVPEEATPWSEMKQQLIEKNKEFEVTKKKQAVIDQRNENYQAFLEKKQEEELNKSQWATFPSINNSKKDISIEMYKNSKDIQSQNSDDSDVPPEEQSSKIEISTPTVKKLNKKKLSIINNSLEKNQTNKTETGKKKQVDYQDTNNKQKNAKLNKESLEPKATSNGNENKQGNKRKQKEECIQTKSKKNKKSENENVCEKPQKKGNVPKKIIKDNLTEADLKKIERKKQKRIKQLEKKKRVKEELKKEVEIKEEKLQNSGSHQNPQIIDEHKQNNNKQAKFEKENNFDNNHKNNRNKSDKKDKILKNKEHIRRKPFQPTKMFINGKEVEIDYVDGFPVKKEDAERLKKLRKEMISKGLPRSEINISLKLERRKAEKAFAREKKKVCFNCRKSGHNLSECPELDKGQMISQSGTGICFKCGSAEHTHFECKVVRGQEFKYAQCFICNEQGHIARQCPDNARGLYPKGGACNVCGDVTHLKKDCPKYQAQQQLQNSFTVDTVGENPDVLDGYNSFYSSSLGNRKPNKIIKF